MTNNPDYTRLRDLLAAGLWKEANQETQRILLKAADIEGKNRLLDAELIQKIPCTDLRTIDQLWVHYSDGRFGLSVQRCIFEYYKYSEKSYEAHERLGWIAEYLMSVKYVWSITAPVGHLPTLDTHSSTHQLLLSRANSCELRPEDTGLIKKIEEIKQRLASTNDETRIAALSDAAEYAGAYQDLRDLMLQMVKTEKESVQWAAYQTLSRIANFPDSLHIRPYYPLPAVSSDVDVDYTRLRDLLSANNWEEADKQTERIMLQVAGRQQEGSFLRREDIEQFPCSVLRTIDELWVQHSNGRFGFSVQQRGSSGAPSHGSYTFPLLELEDWLWYKAKFPSVTSNTAKWVWLESYNAYCVEGNVPIFDRLDRCRLCSN
ncbi:MAG: GUN4 domain-containing protein [Nostocaceae cyanobacterium]|nr:GUN4 domain-containing protein [Nostocaceae cyanobacterium]